jgi:hypothetical protein
MRHLLSLLDFLGKRDGVVGLADPLIVGSPELVALTPHRAGRAVASVSGQADDTVDDLPYAQDQQKNYQQGTRVPR